MTVPPKTAAPLSREEKQALLRRRLVQRLSQARTEPASFAQERLWFLERMNGAGPLYTLSEALRLAGPLVVPALERAVGEVVRRHEALRTTFREVDGAPVQVITPFAGFTLPVHDLSALPADAREAEVRRHATGDAALAFDLEQGPLFRTRLLRLADDEHVLLLCMHHVVTDGWSMGVIFREASAAYAAYREGGEPALPALPWQYAHYAAEQRGRLRGEALEGEVEWWKERLAGAPALLDLPTDHPRPAVPSYRGAAERVEIPPDVVERLQALAGAEGASLYMVLLGAFQLLLGTYAGTDDVVVGSPIAGRARLEVEGLVGFFVNTLVLRTDLSGDPGFRELLRRVRAATLGAYAHQEVPFERLVAELQPERGTGHSPLFQAMFTLNEAGAEEEGFAGLRVSRVTPEVAAAKFDLLLRMAPDGEGLAGELVYATDLFDGATIRRMRAHLGRVLEQVAADPDLRLSHLRLPDRAERERVLYGWNRTATRYPDQACIHGLFAEQAAATPDAVAVVFGAGTLTYGELDARAGALARHLANAGVRPGDRVGLALERSLEVPVALLGVLRAGAAYVPLDAAYPPGRLAGMLADAAVSVLVVRDALPASLAGFGGRVVSLAAEGDAIDACRGAPPPEVPVTAESEAYVMFTSGSTGRPKGVAVPHRAVVRLVRGADFAEFGPDQVFLQLAPLSFDASTLELWGPLLNGGRLVVFPPHAPSLEELGAALGEHGVTVLWLTAGLFHPMVELQLESLGGLRQLLAGGDVLSPEHVLRVLERFPALRVTNGYGPTENTTFTCCHDARPEDARRRSIPIGRPIANTRAWVLDAALRPVPVGVPGELCAGGDGLALGYVGQPALTEERFVEVELDGRRERVYRTGDRVRWQADGTLEFLGRLDEQVKIRGFRVEPGEIEAALRRHPGVSDCAVTARDDGAAGRRLVAYVVGQAGAKALRAHLRGTLPDYMVPAAFVALDALPLTPNAKVDRGALPPPDPASDGDGFVAPRTPAEEVLAGIWAGVLGLERVGVHDDFFRLGGHSLLATRVVSRVRAVFGVELPLRLLFEDPTVAALAERVEGMRRAGIPRLPPVVPVERTDALPLSFAQERLWFLDRMEPESPFYNIPVAVRLDGALDAGALERALGEVVRRHESLRTTFRESAGVPVQGVMPFAGFALPAEDLSSLGAAEREAAVRRRAAEDAARPFDLAAGPLLRASLLRLDEEAHVLLLCIHHIASDGWSMGVLFRELSALYGAYREGRASPLPELAVQYGDYAAWQRAQLQGPVLDRQLAYWRERLAGAPALLELPADRPRPPVQSHRGAREALDLSPGLLERLRGLGRREGATLHMVLLGALQALLSRYAGTGDVLVGTPVAGRTGREVEELIGFFVNTLVLRTDLSGDPPFREVLRRVREATLGAYEHQELPFEKLVAELQPERSLSHAPLFQVMLSLLEEARGWDEGLPGLRTSAVETDVATTKFDLTLAFDLADGRFRALLSYATDLFDRATAARMTGHLARVLEQVAEDPDARISALSLLSDDERTQVVDGWNRTAADYPAHASIHQLVGEQAARTPHAVALVSAGESLTYRELDARASRLANHLVRLGAGPEARVGICLERSPQMVVALLAVLRAGAAYLPLDPSYPADRLAYMLEDSGAPLLVTQESLRALLPTAGVRVVSIDGDAAAIAREPEHDPGVAVDPAGAAYVIYTSGSTGRPKGVQVTHGNAVSLFAGMDGRVGGSRPGTWLAVTRISFDIHVLELLWTLARGFRVVVQPEPDRARDGESIAEQIRRHAVTHLQCTPSLAGMLITESGIEALSGLERLLLGGEALPADLAARITAALPDGLVNLYGPTETTVYSVSHAVTADGPVLIGRPIANTRVYVLDGALRPQPVGVPGEMMIGGPGVTRGYHGRPALTAERFVPDPFGPAGSRLYRTGDRGRWTAAGVLEYLGRLDAQVKIRGFRIEPGEIESVLRRHPGVAECAVVARAAGAGDVRLVAYVVGEAEADVLRAHVGRSLPDYMVPSAFVPLDALPLTPSGKLDRAALPAPDFTAAADAYVAPRTPAEEVLAGIWAQVLGVERVGVTESFFALGGHSLLVTRVVARVREVFGVPLPLRVLFETPTVAALAERVEALRGAGTGVLPPVVPVERGGDLPLSYGQERLWFLGRLEPDNPAYNHPLALRLEGELDVPALERALGEVVRRHESLRTVFPERDGAPVQRVLPFTGLALAAGDLSWMADAAREAALRQALDEEVRRPFDLAEGPVLLARLLRLGAEEHVLLLSLHHVSIDGGSLRVLFRELWTLYDAFREGRASPLAELAVQYADYAAWQRRHLRGEVVDRQLAYWKERMAGAAPLLELPTDRPRPRMQSYRGAREPVRIPAPRVERLEALARAEGATLYMVLLGAFQVLLGRYAGTDDVVVGSPIAGRTRREVEELIGFFVNTLVLRTDLSGDPAFREVLRRVREVTLGAYENQDVPFERLVEALQPERSLGHAPLFQVMFTLHLDGPEAAPPGLRWEPMGIDRGTTKVDLALALARDADGLHGELEFASDLFDRATAARMTGHLARVLEQVAEDPDARISALSLLSDDERTQVVDGWNRTAADYPAHASIHQLVGEQAARTPHAVALVSAGESLTYRELDARASRLANHLVRLGAGPEARVGICLERSAQMVVALLAVLRAGAAYLPLDPSYPADRLAYMLEDSGAPLLVTQESLRALLPTAGVRVVSIDGDAAAIAREPESAPRVAMDPDGAAYVIYTSGSTGRPKGVQVTHGNAVSFFAGMDGRVGGSRPGTWLAVTRISFDIHVLELLWTLARGFRVVVQPEPDRARDGESIAEQIRRHAVTHLQCTPSLAGMLIAESGIEALSGLERLLLGGEALPADLAAWITAVLPDGLVNLYGPTETTVWSATHAVAAGGPVLIGRPIANTRVYVLDGALRPQPVGVPGEMMIGGPGVTRGYHGRPALTAERFVPDPFGPAGSRLYRTGDRGRWTAAGVLEYLGRLDAQVKIRGFRIEPGEIESVLRRHPGVAECAVVPRAAGAGDVRLVAYVVGEAEADALRAHVGRSLPDYMVPSAFVPLDALPLTPSGKLDRAALPAPDFTAAAPSPAPRNELEQRVARVWQDVLGRPSVGVSENFFDLGGTSLLLARVFAGLREIRGDLRMVDLFRYTTVESLAGYLGAETPAGASALAGSRSRAEERRAARRRARA